jgi:hypothetical protein
MRSSIRMMMVMVVSDGIAGSPEPRLLRVRRAGRTAGVV